MIFLSKDLSKFKKILNIDKHETCVKFQQKALRFTVVGVRSSVLFFGQNTWFLENNRALSKLLYEILHYLSSIIKS